jgi:outer membrane protein
MLFKVPRKPSKSRLFAAICSLCIALLTILAPGLPTLAADSALTGLGEPAAPGSMAAPNQLFPSSASQSSELVPATIQSPGTPAPSSLSSGSAPPKAIPGGSGTNSNALAPILHPRIEKQEPRAFTLSGAIQYADQNYPTIKKQFALVDASKKGVTLQKLNEYLPDSLFQYQLLFSSHNKITEMFYGSPVFPADPGPGFNAVTMEPYFSSGAGFSIDWAPIDFGLHKARIQYAKTQYKQSLAGYDVTKLDVQIATASAFLDVVQALEQVRAMEENVASFTQFYDVVHAQVASALKPGADQSLATAQLANAQNQLLRARLSQELALANLANSIGLGGQSVAVEAKGIASYNEPGEIQKAAPIFENVPIVKASQAVLSTAIAQRRVLNKEYAPVFHFLGGFNLRGAGQALSGRGTDSQGAAGVVPIVPNYQLAMIVNWNFLDWFRIRQEKKVQDQRIAAQQYDYDLVLQNIKTEDVKARAQIQTAVALAANMPVQVEAAEMAASQALARYQTGLGSVAQLAEAKTLLAQSRMQEAIARVGVWRAMLQVAAVHGDLRPFMVEADRIQKGS